MNANGVWNFGWVLDGELAGMAIPDAEGWRTLHDLGIRAVVSLTEGAPPGDPRAAGLVWRHHPIRDFGVPDDRALEKTLAWMAARIDEGKPVVVHCHAGVGRTGLVLAAFLVRRGLDPRAAIQAVRDRRPGSIETAAQRRMVEALGEGTPEDG